MRSSHWPQSISVMLLMFIGNQNVPAGGLELYNPYIKFDCSLSITVLIFNHAFVTLQCFLML